MDAARKKFDFKEEKKKCILLTRLSLIFNLHVFGHKKRENLASVCSHHDSLQFRFVCFFCTSRLFVPLKKKKNSGLELF